MPNLQRLDDVFVLDLGDDENRFTREWMTAITDALDEVDAAEGPRALLTVATGKFWSNGLDLDWLSAHLDQGAAYIDQVQGLFARYLQTTVPTVAVLQGHTFAAGALLALAHDRRLMRADRGFFCLPEVDISIPFAPGMSALIQAKLTPDTAQEAMLTGRRYGGTEALEAGIVTDALPEDELLPTATEWARSQSGKAGPTLRTIRTHDVPPRHRPAGPGHRAATPVLIRRHAGRRLRSLHYRVPDDDLSGREPLHLIRGALTVRGVKMTTDGIRLVGPTRGPADGDVRVTVASSGICGSDLHLAAVGPSWAVLGHEFSGTLDDGTPVAVLPVVHCGDLRPVPRRLRSPVPECARPPCTGSRLDGGLADEVWVHPSCPTPLPAGVPLEDASLVEPLAVALHGLHRAGVVEGMRILVLGAGPVGLCTVAAARHLGADVDVEGHRPNRAAAAERLGGTLRTIGTTTTWSSTPPAPSHRSTEPPSWPARAAPSGILGTFWDPVALGLAFQMKELTLVPSFTYGHHHGVDEFAEATRILAGTPDLADTVVSHRFALDEAAEAFRVAADRREDPIKVVVLP